MLPIELEDRIDYLHLRPTDKVQPRDSMDLLRQLLAECHARRVTKLLVDLSSFSNRQTSLSQQFLFAVEVCQFWDRAVKVAIIGNPQDLQPWQFSILVANNRGLAVGAFTTEEDGHQWLFATTQAYFQMAPGIH